MLKGKTLGYDLSKNRRRRTRVSFETGMYQLGGNGACSCPIAICRSVAANRLADTARVLSRYLDGIMIRTFRPQVMWKSLPKYADVPVINALDGSYCIRVRC